jgi:hypothetical protein
MGQQILSEEKLPDGTTRTTVLDDSTGQVTVLEGGRIVSQTGGPPQQSEGPTKAQTAFFNDFGQTYGGQSTPEGEKAQVAVEDPDEGVSRLEEHTFDEQGRPIVYDTNGRRVYRQQAAMPGAQIIRDGRNAVRSVTGEPQLPSVEEEEKKKKKKSAPPKRKAAPAPEAPTGKFTVYERPDGSQFRMPTEAQGIGGTVPGYKDARVVGYSDTPNGEVRPIPAGPGEQAGTAVAQGTARAMPPATGASADPEQQAQTQGHSAGISSLFGGRFDMRNPANWPQDQQQGAAPGAAQEGPPAEDPYAVNHDPNTSTYLQDQEELRRRSDKNIDDAADLAAKQAQEIYDRKKALFEEDQRIEAEYKAQQDKRRAQYDAYLEERRLEAEALSKMKVDPNAYWHNKSTGDKVGLMIFGAISGALDFKYGRGGNKVIDAINAAIDRDIDAQKANITHAGNMYDRKMTLYQKYYEIYRDEESARSKARADYWDSAVREIDLITSQYADEQSRIAAEALKIEAIGKRDEARQKFIDEQRKIAQQDRQIDIAEAGMRARAAKGKGGGGKGSKDSAYNDPKADPELVVDNLEVPVTDEKGNPVYVYTPQTDDKGSVRIVQPVRSSRAGGAILRDENGRPVFSEGRLYADGDPNIPVDEDYVVEQPTYKDGKRTGTVYVVMRKKQKTTSFVAPEKTVAREVREIAAAYQDYMDAMDELDALQREIGDGNIFEDEKTSRQAEIAVQKAFTAIRKLDDYKQTTQDESEQIRKVIDNPAARRNFIWGGSKEVRDYSRSSREKSFRNTLDALPGGSKAMPRRRRAQPKAPAQQVLGDQKPKSQRELDIARKKREQDIQWYRREAEKERRAGNKAKADEYDAKAKALSGE